MSAEEDVQRLVDEGEEADAIVRGAVARLAADRAGGVGLRFVEEGAFVEGPWVGPSGPVADAVPVSYDGDVVAELVATGPLDDRERAAWERIALLLSPFCLVGWDIGGEEWEP
jgi:hypothetical protein